VTDTPTITPTLPPFPYTITVGIYNQAGELVKTVAETLTNNSMGNVNFYLNGDMDRFTDTLTTDSHLGIYLPGVETPDTMGSPGSMFNWYSDNNALQTVDAGVYYVKVTQKDEFGHTNVVTRQIQIIKAEEFVELKVFNSAGELVRTIREHKKTEGSNISLRVNEVMIIEKGGSNFTIRYAEGTDDYLQWDGLSSHGVSVSSGVYELQVVVKTFGGQSVLASKSITVLNEGDEYLEDIQMHPNPVNTFNHSSARITWTGAGAGDVKVSIYNMKGELVRQFASKLETGYVDWDLKTQDNSSAATGMYIILVEAHNNEGYFDRKHIKAGVQR